MLNHNNQKLIDRLRNLDKIPEKKTVATNEEIKGTIRNIVSNDQSLNIFINSLKDTQWNPKTLELCCEALSQRFPEISADAVGKYILSVLQANRRGKWLPGMVRALSLLLNHKNANAMRLLREIIMRPKKSGGRNSWDFYQLYLINYLSPNQGLPYILSLALESWPKEMPKPIEEILKGLLEKIIIQDKYLLVKETQEALGDYLKKRCQNLETPFQDIEYYLLRLIASQKIPEWRDQLTQVAGRLRAFQATGEIRWASEILKKLAPQIYEQQIKQEIIRESSKPFQAPSLSPMELLLAKKEGFIIEFNEFLRLHEELQNEYNIKAKELEEAKEEIKQLKEILRENKKQLAAKEAQMIHLERARELLVAEKKQLETRIDYLSEQILEEQKRAETRVHQIQIDAERRILEFKDKLWRRLAPDLEDFLSGELSEDAYANPERGRRLYHRLMDIIGILKQMQVIPAGKIGEES